MNSFKRILFVIIEWLKNIYFVRQYGVAQLKVNENSICQRVKAGLVFLCCHWKASYMCVDHFNIQMAA